MSSRDNGLRCSQHRLFARNFRSFPHFLPFRPLSIESPEFVSQSTTRGKGEHGAKDRPGPTCNCILDGETRSIAEGRAVLWSEDIILGGQG